MVAIWPRLYTPLFAKFKARIPGKPLLAGSYYCILVQARVQVKFKLDKLIVTVTQITLSILIQVNLVMAPGVAFQNPTSESIAKHSNNQNEEQEMAPPDWAVRSSHTQVACSGV